MRGTLALGRTQKQPNGPRIVGTTATLVADPHAELEGRTGGTRPVPIAVVGLVALLLLSTAVLMAARSLALSGDGSFYLVRLLGTEDVVGPDARVLANAVRQAPVLAALRLGLTDTYLLSLLLGVGQLVVPAAIWGAALLLTRARPLAFSAVAMTAGLCAGTTWFFSVGENVIAVPVTVLVGTLLWLPREWRWRHVALHRFSGRVRQSDGRVDCLCVAAQQRGTF